MCDLFEIFFRKLKFQVDTRNDRKVLHRGRTTPIRHSYGHRTSQKSSNSTMFNINNCTYDYVRVTYDIVR